MPGFHRRVALLLLLPVLVSGRFQYSECTYNTYRARCLSGSRTLNRESYRLETFPEPGASTCLKLKNNRIASFPADLKQLEAVTVIDLSNNHLTHLPDDLATLSKLEILDVSNNRLSSMSSAVRYPVSLRGLLLAGNQLTTLPSGLQVPGLFVLDLSNNKFTSVPASFCVSRQLTRVDFTNNPLQSDITTHMNTLNECRNVNDIPFCVFSTQQEVQCDCHSLYPVLGQVPAFCLGTPLRGWEIKCNGSSSTEKFKRSALFDIDVDEVRQSCNFALMAKAGADHVTVYWSSILMTSFMVVLSNLL